MEEMKVLLPNASITHATPLGRSLSLLLCNGNRPRVVLRFRYYAYWCDTTYTITITSVTPASDSLYRCCDNNYQRVTQFT